MFGSPSLLKKNDPEIFALIAKEDQRQHSMLEMIASENLASPAVQIAMGSCLTDKYAEGLPGKRYYGGCEYVDEIETLAIQRCKKLFGCEHVNVQPHSGSQANMAAYFASVKLSHSFNFFVELNNHRRFTNNPATSYPEGLFISTFQHYHTFVFKRFVHLKTQLARLNINQLFNIRGYFHL